MFVTIHNPPKKISNKLLREATEFYINKLLSSQLTNKLSIDIKFRRMKTMYGNCYRLDDLFPPSEFRIGLALNMSKTNILMTLAHELTHVMQFVTGTLKEKNGVYKWNNKRHLFKKKEERFTPWEREAIGSEEVLYDLFIEHIKKHGKNKYCINRSK